jgi:glycosyltransferase involved in cell wall biosynthesis
MPQQDKNFALIHEFLNQYGGAERVLLEIAKLYPDAPIYTIMHDPEKMRGFFKGRDIRTSFMQKIPAFIRRRHKYLLPLMPTAPETFNLRDYDVVISSSSAFAKGVVVKPKTVHVCYCHSPMRYAWDWNEKYLNEQGVGSKRKFAARFLLNYVRMWDRVAADRVDYFIANSVTTAKRLKKYYGCDARVVYPPVDVEKLSMPPREGDALNEQLKKEDYFLIISRLTPYKKIEVAIEALNKLDLPLIVIGEGAPKYEKQLRSIAGRRTKFLGWVKEADIACYYRNCRAFIFPGEDDFGIAPVEAMASGRPVIALRKGGATETVTEGVSGEFFDESALELVADGVRRFLEKETGYDPQTVKNSVARFSIENFRQNFSRAIDDFIADYDTYFN